jgi:hypothetical protein
MSFRCLVSVLFGIGSCLLRNVRCTKLFSVLYTFLFDSKFNNDGTVSQ